MGDDGPNLLKRPNQRGFMGPLAILCVHTAMTDLAGEEEAQSLLRAAQIHRLPDRDEPVRETKVASLHQALRAEYPELAHRVLSRAGRMTADSVMDRRMSRRAQNLLISAPWPLAAWLLGKSTEQNAWTFSGSGKFEILNRVSFRLTNNPVIKGETAEDMICTYHAAMFTRFFSSLVHDQLTCTEVSCAARGDKACEFVIHSVDKDIHSL